MKTKSRLFGWAFALLVVVLTVAPRPAYAANDILVGMFFTSDSDYTNSIYVSYDGKKMTRVATTYDTQGRDGAGSSVYYDSNKNAHYGQMDPSIMYYGGKFWSISGWNRYDGKFWPMISYSTDLVHWTHPEGDVLINGTHGISLNKYPTGFSKSKKGFDTVAPEWFISKNGSVYIIFSAGYYGAFHGDATNDRMQAYMVKVTKLSADEGVADGDTKYLWPQNLTFKTGKAKRISIPGNSAKNANYIDGSMFVNGSTDYLVVKKGGLTNQIYKTSNIDANKWTLVNSKATFGYEGASVAKLGSTFYMAADHVTGATADGVKLFKSTSLTKTGWSAAGTKFVTKAGKTCKVRHGSIIKLKEGTAGWRVAASLMKLSIKKAVVSSIANKTYTGEAITPTLTVKLNGTKLKLNTDYTLKYANNTKVGTATVTITGKGCYTGTKKVTFKIVKAASTVKLVAQTKTYTGKAIAYSGKVTKTGSKGKVTYKYYSDKACKKAVKASKVKAAGTYYVKATLAADANHNGATSAAAKLTVKKAANPMKVKAVKRTAKLAKVKKKAVTVAAPLKFTSKAQGKVTYARVAKGSAKCLTVNKKTGKVTVKKGTKKGTYKVKIKVTAAGTKNYKSGTKTVTCTVAVK